jgi:WD40 repeat protein
LPSQNDSIPPARGIAAPSPDGKSLFAAKSAIFRGTEIAPKPGLLRAVDYLSGRELRRVNSGPDERFRLLTVSPKGKSVAVVVLRGFAGVGDRTVRLFDIATGLERFPRLGSPGAVPPPNKGEGAIRGPGKACAAASLAFSRDGSLLASGPGWDGNQSYLNNWAPITLWDVAAGREVRRLVGHPCEIRSLAFSPDGKTLASSGGGPVARIWDVRTGREVDQRAGHPHGILAMADSIADGTIFTTGNDDGLVLRWDPSDGRALETVAVKPNRFHGLKRIGQALRMRVDVACLVSKPAHTHGRCARRSIDWPGGATKNAGWRTGARVGGRNGGES